MQNLFISDIRLKSYKDIDEYNGHWIIVASLMILGPYKKCWIAERLQNIVAILKLDF